MTYRSPIWVLVLVGLGYVLAPGVAWLPLSGIPIGQTGIVVLTAVIGAWIWTRGSATPADGRWVALIAVAILIKVTLATVTPHTGWLGRYYANENFAGPFEPSMDFRGLDATRIDVDLTLRDTEFPVHFFNDREYNTGIFREYSLPFSVQWTGHVFVDRAQDGVTGAIAANGRAELLLDGVRQAVVAAPGQAVKFQLAMAPGPHMIEVRYQKPADTAPMLSVEEAPGTAAAFLAGQVSPFALARPLSGLTVATFLAITLHLAVIAAIAAAFWPRLRDRRGVRLVPVAVVGILVGQGLWKSRHLVGHVWTMSGGDDWLNYEMSARDVVLHGLIMSQGGVIGRGQPFSLYPGYAYFVALVHAVTGESLAGVVLMNFVVLACATLVAYRIGRLLFGTVGALAGLGWLLVLEQADFVRYYTVTLFSENLYFLLAAATVWFLMTYHARGGRRDLVWAGVCGALAAWTRPSIMLLLPFGFAGIVWVRWRTGALRQAAIDGVVFVAAWMAAVAPITIRNYIMSGNPVLLTSGQGATFVAYNMPVDDKMYFKGFDGTLFNAAMILIRMFVDHPVISSLNYGRKLGFSLGMVHWLGGSGTIHPELLLTSLGYFAAVAVLKSLRSTVAWPIHAFIVTHIATLMLTMPSNYGYRMILPSFVFMALAAGALAVAPLTPRIVARWPSLADSIDGAAR